MRYVAVVSLSYAVACAPTSVGPAQPAFPTVDLLRTGHRVVAYYPAWASLNADAPYLIADVPADVLTHLNYAFANISETGEIIAGYPRADTARTNHGASDKVFHGNFRELQRLKDRYPHLRTLISVGGWEWSGQFSTVAATAESRRRFAESAVDFLTRFGFDGVDLDWEFPATDGLHPGRPEDAVNFTLLLAAVRHALREEETARGRRYYLTIAAPGDLGAARKLQWTEIHRYVDWINVMAYDFAGTWSQKTVLNGALYPTDRLEYDGSLLNEQANARDLLFGYLEANVPAEKIILGVSFGGKAWYGVPNRNNGLFQPYGGGAVAPTTYIRATEVQHRMQEFWHEEAQVPWLFDPETGLMITFENSRSMWLKGAFARENRLGGVMLWQIAGDDSSHVLLRSLVAGVIGNTKGMP